MKECIWVFVCLCVFFYHFSFSPSTSFGKIWNRVRVNHFHLIPLSPLLLFIFDALYSSLSSGRIVKRRCRVILGSLGVVLLFEISRREDRTRWESWGGGGVLILIILVVVDAAVVDSDQLL